MKNRKSFLGVILSLILVFSMFFQINTQAVVYRNTWKKVNHRLCYYDQDGKRLKSQYQYIRGVLYHFNKDGYMVGGLRKTVKGLRYQKKDGRYLKKAWKTVKGNTYYFNSRGYAAKSCWVGNYYVDSQGRRVKSNWVKGGVFVDARGKKVTAASLDLSAKAAVLMDAKTGKCLYRKNAGMKLSNASTTKIMTAILALEKGNPNDIVTFSDNAAGQEPVKLYANAGESFRLGDLMYALLLPSYNDVAVAIAEHISGSTEKFAQLMNRKARQLGCRNTTFVTPSGLDQGNHGTSAMDLARIARYAIRNQKLMKIVGTTSYQFSSTSSGRGFAVQTTNQLLGEFRGVKGLKTGYTSKAGHCFVGVLKRKGQTFISVVLGAPTSSARWEDTEKLLEFGIKNYR